MKVGVLGGGQLARMLALAGYPLGIELICIDPNDECSAKKVTKVIQAEYTDLDKINEHFHDVDCVTYETENLPINAVESIAGKYKMLPSLEALKITQDRLLEKNFINSLNIPTARYFKIDNYDDLLRGLEVFGFPSVLKTRKSGYDGKGQAVLRTWDDAKVAWQTLSQYALILEEYIKFDSEVSIISVRSSSGEIKSYPLILNQHKDGILSISQSMKFDDQLNSVANKYASLILDKFNYVGVMTIEFFNMDGNLIVNEIAPRVHNSGHWTIEAAETSQFENHLRAILSLPIGSTQNRSLFAMINILNTYKNIKNLLEIHGLHYHSYDKKPRVNRKIGHVTICDEDQRQLNNKIKDAINLILE